MKNKHIGEQIDQEERKIAARLFRLRTQLGIERHALAEVIGISETELANYELAVEPIAASELALIAAACGITLEYFFNDSDVEENFIQDNHPSLLQEENLALIS